MRVFCYFNLHKNCFSLRALEGPSKGRVIAHADQVHLQDVSFRVSQAGRARVLRERAKNVHAGAVGQLQGWLARGAVPDDAWLALEKRLAAAGGLQVSYDPYKAGYFYERSTGAEVLEASEAWFRGRSLVATQAQSGSPPIG